jgi:type I restriction enzyme M protein
VLFEGGAGAGALVRRQLRDTCDLHTVLRLPTGISPKGGVKANLLFFTKKPALEAPWRTETWFYDFWTNKHFALKRHKLTRPDLQEFVDAYRVEDRSQREESERFKKFTHAELVARDGVNLDITWLKDDDHLDPDDLPDPDVLAAAIAEGLFAAADEMRRLADELAPAAPALTLNAPTAISDWVNE